MVNYIESKPKLLIAEDDSDNQSFLRLLLNKYFIVDICDSADSFYQFMKRNKYDIILMDISLKGNKNGLELTKELKSDPNTRSIPIICYTAHALNSDRTNALNAGCNAYISKPSNIYTLLNTLFSFVPHNNFFVSENGSISGLAIA